MKKLMVAILIMMSFASCSAPLSARMEDYIDDIEADCSNWTEKDWELSQEEYAKLIDEYEENYSSYTQEERDAINRAIGRYTGLMVRKGIESAGSVFEEFANRLPALFDGFMSAFEDDYNDK